MYNINKIIFEGQLTEEEIKEFTNNIGSQGLITIPSIETVTNLTQLKLYDTVVKFMKEQDITCEETIHQMDNVIENAYDFITDLFNIVKDDLDIEEEE